MTGAEKPGGVTWELHERTPEGSARVTPPPDQWTPEMVEAFNGMMVGRVEPLRMVPLSDEQMVELRRSLAAGPRGASVIHQPELGPVEGMAIVKSMQRHLNRIGGEHSALVRRVAELERENRRLSDVARHECRRALLALESMGTLADSLAKAEETAALAREAYQVPLPLDDWHEDIGPVLWWFFPVQEAPWCGTPECSDWPGYHTHWTPLPGVMQPDGVPANPTPVPAHLRKAGS